MPKMNLTIPHTLTQEEAITKIKSFMKSNKESMEAQVKDVSHQWEAETLTFAFKTMGMKISGTMTVHEDNVGIRCDLPFSAMMFKGKIESTVTEQLGKLLA